MDEMVPIGTVERAAKAAMGDGLLLAAKWAREIASIPNCPTSGPAALELLARMLEIDFDT